MRKFENYEKFFRKHRQVSVVWAQSNHFLVDSATELTKKQHKNIYNQLHTKNCRIDKCLFLDCDQR